jgi:hypothetical protein
MILLTIILVVFLAFSVVLLTAALCMLCMEFYDEIYGETESTQGD